MKKLAARILLLLGLGCMLASFIPGQPAGWLVVTVTFALGSVVFGRRWFRISGALLTIVSVMVVILKIQATRESKELVQQMQNISQSRAIKTEKLRQKLVSVSTTDGVSKSEAETIAECYFDQHVACGAFTGIRDGGDSWIVEGMYGYAGKQVEGFQIDKRTGKLTSPIGPSYSNPFQIFP